MKDINIRHLDMGRRVRDFVDANAGEFPVGSRAAELIVAIKTAVTKMETAGAKQDAARVAGKQATDQKDALRSSILGGMRPINRTARGMEKLFPGIGAQFAMPRGGGDQPVLNRVQAFIAGGEEFAAEFAKRGVAAAAFTELGAGMTAMTDAIQAQNVALAAETQATAEVNAGQAQLKDAVRELSPIVMNTFAKDAGKLAAWKSASHVERAPKKKKTPTPPPPPPPVK
jgi:hypothetical protein